MKNLRFVAMFAVYHLAVAFMWVGHVIVQLAGAVDSIVAAALGVPRLSYTARRVAEVMRETWEAGR